MAEPSSMGEPAPRVLVVTSAGAPGAVVTPVLAALEAAGAEIRAVDVGRMSPHAGWRVWQVVIGELAERKLHQELAESPPDVAIAFDPAAAAAVAAARDEALEGAPVVAVVPELEPDSSWGASDADRYLTLDDEAAVALADAGVPEDRVVPVGPVGERSFAEAAAEPRQSARERFKLGRGPIVLVEVGGLGGETASQIALQLSLLKERPLFLFDAGDDTDAAQTLRAQVPTLEIRAKLFGTTRDAPRFWRAADVIIARPRPRAVARSLVLGARLVGLSPEGEEEEKALGALESRGLAAAAANPLMLSSALEPLLRKPARDDDRIAADGAENVADAAWIVGRERDSVLGEIHAARRAERSARVEAAASAAESHSRRARAAGDLEDLGAGAEVSEPRGASASGEGVDRQEIDELLRQIGKRTERGKKRLVDARQAADSWQKRAEEARAAGDEEKARAAQAKAEHERERMHEVLAELSELEKESTRLRRARAAAGSARASGAKASSSGGKRAAAGAGAKTGRPAGDGARGSSVDDLLEKLKRDQASGAASASGKAGKQGGARGSSGKSEKGGDIDEELEAIKRKIEESRRRR